MVIGLLSYGIFTFIIMTAMGLENNLLIPLVGVMTVITIYAFITIVNQLVMYATYAKCFMMVAENKTLSGELFFVCMGDDAYDKHVTLTNKI